MSIERSAPVEVGCAWGETFGSGILSEPRTGVGDRERKIGRRLRRRHRRKPGRRFHGQFFTFPDASVPRPKSSARASEAMERPSSIPAGAGPKSPACHFQYVTDAAFRNAAFTDLCSGGSVSLRRGPVVLRACRRSRRCQLASQVGTTSDYSAPSRQRRGRFCRWRGPNLRPARGPRSRHGRPPKSPTPAPPSDGSFTADWAPKPATSSNTEPRPTTAARTPIPRELFSARRQRDQYPAFPSAPRGRPLAPGTTTTSVSSPKTRSASSTRRRIAPSPPPSPPAIEAVLLLGSHRHRAPTPCPDQPAGTSRPPTASNTASPRTTSQSTPAPDGEITGTAETPPPHVPEVHITGLQQGAAYHFRIIAENQWGTATTEDQTFEFFPPACPNSAVRQQTGSAYLPDCRAYELVSPANANGTLLYSGGPNTRTATSPRASPTPAPSARCPAPRNTIGTAGDLYVATRTDTGWDIPLRRPARRPSRLHGRAADNPWTSQWPRRRQDPELRPHRSLHGPLPRLGSTVPAPNCFPAATALGDADWDTRIALQRALSLERRRRPSSVACRPTSESASGSRRRASQCPIAAERSATWLRTAPAKSPPPATSPLRLLLQHRLLRRRQPAA